MNNQIKINSVLFQNESVKAYTLKEYVPKDLKGISLITGPSGSGKDFLLSKYFKINVNRKILFIGLEGNFTGPFSYLEKMNFIKSNEDADFSNAKIFISSYSDTINYATLENTIKEAFKREYIVVLNEIDIPYGEGSETYFSLVKRVLEKHSRNSKNDMILVSQQINHIDIDFELLDNLILIKGNSEETYPNNTKNLFVGPFVDPRGNYIILRKKQKSILDFFKSIIKNIKRDSK